MRAVFKRGMVCDSVNNSVAYRLRSHRMYQGVERENIDGPDITETPNEKETVSQHTLVNSLILLARNIHDGPSDAVGSGIRIFWRQEELKTKHAHMHEFTESAEI